jgi:hypothetical protein
MDSIDVYHYARGWSDARAGVALSLSEPAAYVDGWRLFALHDPARVAGFACMRANGYERQIGDDVARH